MPGPSADAVFPVDIGGDLDTRFGPNPTVVRVRRIVAFGVTQRLRNHSMPDRTSPTSKGNDPRISKAFLVRLSVELTVTKPSETSGYPRANKYSVTFSA